MSVTFGTAWRRVRDRFRDAGLDTPEIDARYLAEAVLGVSGGDLVRRESDPMPPGAQQRLDAFAERRLAGEPVARILGAKAFYGRDFILNAATLVPRPETELLVTLGMKALRARSHATILDLGTGTGCIAISLLAELPDAQAVGVDFSVEALDAARANAVRHGVGDRLSLAAGSWFDPLGPGEVFDLIVSNPPYIETSVISTLMSEVRDHDPVLALDGGPDGLAAYRTILADAGERLNPGGALILEIGSTQGTAVAGIARANGFLTIALEKDLSGLDRALVVHHS
ncbi:MAG TPA: peptide chain release factor N(5)-glutamine methyltransferase [Sphingomicrobium sp.]|nr:peptide chain release factor N(5)-glutamine methyltransferase [Sphingomicrobium sp.]